MFEAPDKLVLPEDIPTLLLANPMHLDFWSNPDFI